MTFLCAVYPNYIWTFNRANPYSFNFDHLGMAMLALFEMLTIEGWTEMRDALLQTGPVSCGCNDYEAMRSILLF